MQNATLKELATETEKTAQQFHRDKSDLDDEGRYYRFNVDRGLEDIGLEESKKKREIAAVTGRYVASQLYGIQPSDPFIASSTVVLLTVVSAAAGLIPAQRASRINPILALRQEG